MDCKCKNFVNSKQSLGPWLTAKYHFIGKKSMDFDQILCIHKC